MKEFQKAIKTYLDNRAKQDAQFAENYAKPNKSIVDCCNYIMRQAQKHKGFFVASNEIEMSECIGTLESLADAIQEVINALKWQRQEKFVFGL